MNDLKSVNAIVERILVEDERTRNSDSFLYLRVLSVIGEKKGLDINGMSVPYFLLNLRELGIPGFETVRRARQKLQAKHPELAAKKKIEDFREENERIFREYARG